MTKFSLIVAAVLGTLSGSLLAQSAQAVRIGSVDELVRKWSPEQHLYVKGELGIGEQQLSHLEAWLDENGPHWTVVLVQQADDEVYHALDGRTFRGMDAVEYALSRGLALRTDFSELVDARTQETDGAVFVLFLQERKFSYYASVAQDVRRLGESHWVGELDRPAFRAMRGGGRILDAVRDTVTNINRRLSEKITAELEQAEREQQSLQRALVHLQTEMKALRTSLDQVAQRAADFKQEYPLASGVLTSPPTQEWRRRLDALEVNLSSNNVRESRQQFQNLTQELEGFLNGYAELDTLEEEIAPLEDALAGLQSATLTDGQPLAKEATQHLAAARAAGRNGDRGVTTLLNQARDAIARGQQAMAAEQQRKDAAIAAEEQRIAQLAARQRAMRTAAIATAAAFGLLLLLVLVGLHVRRRPARQRALEGLLQREAEVRTEMDKIYGLFERNNQILGSEESVKQRGYLGTTKQLVEHAFDDVDDLLVMSAEIERVMQEARELIRPQTLPGRLANLFSRSRFEQGLNHIQGEPLTFHRDKGLPLVIRRESETAGKELPAEVTMTFAQVFQALHDRSAVAVATLDTVEHSLLHVDDELNNLQQQIEQASAMDRRLADAADDDGLLALPTLFEVLIPAAQADYDAAEEIAAEDPVQAMQQQIPSGLRKVREALQLAESILHTRKVVFPQLNTCAPALKELGYATDWMQVVVDDLGQQANGILQDATAGSVAERVQDFAADIVGLGERVEATTKLAREFQRDETPLLGELEESIEAARREVSAKLEVSPDSCLREPDADPDGHHNAASKLLEGARASLQQGDVTAARQAQRSLHAEVEAAQLLVDQTLEVLNEFDALHLAHQQECNEVRAQVPRREQLLLSIRDEFSESARRLQAADPSYEDPLATVDTHLTGCQAALEAADELMVEAAERFQGAQLLQASHRLQQAQGQVARAAQWLEEIAQHCANLHEVHRENEAKLASLQGELSSLQATIEDRRTMQPTLTDYHRVSEDLDRAQQQILSSVPRDPFVDRTTLRALAERSELIATKAAADHEAFAEAQRAVEGVRQQRGLAEQLVQRARHDGIPDSAATTSGIREIQAFDHRLAALQRELEQPHNDWMDVDQAAARLQSEIGREAGELRGELERAEQTMAMFETASTAVLDATRWTGGFGVRIFGAPGSAELERARQAMQRGNYAAMAELAHAAQVAAQQAIRQAQRQVERRQREQARKAEAARRRRRQQSMRINSGHASSGGFHSSTFGSSSSSHASSSSSSSSSPSGSGFSRSGW